MDSSIHSTVRLLIFQAVDSNSHKPQSDKGSVSQVDQTNMPPPPLLKSTTACENPTNLIHVCGKKLPTSESRKQKQTSHTLLGVPAHVRKGLEVLKSYLQLLKTVEKFSDVFLYSWRLYYSEKHENISKRVSQVFIKVWKLCRNPESIQNYNEPEQVKVFSERIKKYSHTQIHKDCF